MTFYGDFLSLLELDRRGHYERSTFYELDLNAYSSENPFLHSTERISAYELSKYNDTTFILEQILLLQMSLNRLML